MKVIVCPWIVSGFVNFLCLCFFLETECTFGEASELFRVVKFIYDTCVQMN